LNASRSKTWIPAFAGMTNKSGLPYHAASVVGAAPTLENLRAQRDRISTL
jgi:hypothetical protein